MEWEWHVFEYDRPMRLHRCMPLGRFDGGRDPEYCVGCGVEVTDLQLYETWKGDVPRPLNASLNMVVLAGRV